MFREHRDSEITTIQLSNARIDPSSTHDLRTFIGALQSFALTACAEKILRENPGGGEETIPRRLTGGVYYPSRGAEILRYAVEGYVRESLPGELRRLSSCSKNAPADIEPTGPRLGTFAWSLTASRNDHLDEGDLLRAIPDHVGHGVSPYMSKEALLQSMRYEGQSDRAAARALWSEMTTFWQDPGPETLAQVILRVKDCGEWKEGFFQIERRQRGETLLQLMDLGSVLADLRLIERSFNDPSVHERNLSACNFLLDLMQPHLSAAA